MKILHLVKKYGSILGGDAIVANNLIKEQRSKGHVVYVYTSKFANVVNDDFTFSNGFEFTSAELDKISIRRLISHIITVPYSFKLLNKLRPNVIHAHAVDLASVFYIAAKLFKAPLILTLHTGAFSNNSHDTLRTIIETVTFKILHFEKVFSVNISDSNAGAKMFHVPNGIDKKIFRKTETIMKDHMLYIGRLEEEKGILALLDAQKILIQKGIKIKLVIIGNGSLYTVIRQFISDNHQDAYIHLLKNIDNKHLPKIYNKAIITILPSTKIEGFGLTLIESIACGTPVITTKLSGLSKFIIENNVGIVLDDPSPTNLSEAIEKLVYNKERLTMLADNCLRSRNKLHDWGAIADQYESHYRQSIKFAK